MAAPGKALLALAKKKARYNDPTIVAKGWMVGYGGDSTRDVYAERFWQTALQTADLLAKGPPRLELLLRAMGDARHQIAVDLNHDPSDDFGKYRGKIDPWSREDLATSFERYASMPCVQAFVAKLEQRGIAADGEHLRGEPHYFFHRFDKAAQSTSKAFIWSVVASLPDGQEVYMTSICRKDPAATHWRWVHGRISDATLAHMENLLAAACAPTAHLSRAKKKAQILPKIALLHWWMAHNTPFKRGSAAVADMLTAALMHIHGMKFSGWKPDVSADVVALCTPNPDDFVREFPDLLRG